MPTPTRTGPTCGELLRRWRERRRLTQWQLSELASVSPRHLSFVETGRSVPSREVILHIADRLDVPLRERNALLLAAGYAPVYRETPFDAEAMAPIREALRSLLDAHLPNPALVVDRHWNLVDANRSALLLAAAASPELLTPPVNVVRLSLHPDGLPRVARNAAAFAAHLVARIERQVELSGDQQLAELLVECRGYLPDPGRPAVPLAQAEEIVTTLEVDSPAGPLRLFTTIATLGTPLDITAAELAIETFLPADPDTAARLRQLLE